MSQQLKLSVIIPVYNAEKYLADCLESVLSQSLKEIEVVCVNDGSTDRSSEILESYAQKDRRVKVIHQSNQGAGPSRNAGIKNAEGKYIAFMDSDDWYPEKDSLESMFTVAEENNALVCGGSQLNYSGNELKPAASGNILYYFKEQGWMEYKDFQQDYYYQRFIFDRNMLLENDIFFPNYRRYQDPPFFLKAMITAGRFYAIPNNVYVYRVDAAHVKWTDEKVNDLFSALIDELNLTREAKLSDLHFRIAHKVLNSDFYHKIIEDSLNQGNVEAARKLGQFAEAIDTELIGKRSGKLNFRYSEVLSTALVVPKKDKTIGSLLKPRGKKKKTGAKVSIIIPVYNTEDYLRQCLESVITQSYENLEILCVNDGSKDNSLSILKEYQSKDDRVVVISQENGGLSAARNTGIRNATGKYLQFLDSDDLLDTNTVHELVNTAEKNQFDMLLFDADSFFETTEIAKLKYHYKKYYYRKHSYSGVYSGMELMQALRKNNEYRSSACLMLLRREWMQNNKICFRNGILHEDNLFTFVCLLNAERSGHVKKQFYLRRIREDSIMTKPRTMRNARGYFECYLGMLDELSRHALSTEDCPEVESIVQEMWNNTNKVYEELKKQGVQISKDILFEKIMVERLEKWNEPKEIIMMAPMQTDTVAEPDCVKEETPITADKEKNSQPEEKTVAARQMVSVAGMTNAVQVVVEKENITFMSYLIAKLKGCVRCYQENGLRYTIHRILVHLNLKKES